MKIVLTALISAVLTSLLWVAVLVIADFYFNGDPPPFRVNIAVPASISVGESLEIVIDVTNPTDSDLVIEGITIDSRLMDGFDLVSISPNPNAYGEGMDSHAFTFSRTIAPRNSLTVVVDLKAKQQGYFGGNIRVFTPVGKGVLNAAGISVTSGTE